MTLEAQEAGAAAFRRVLAARYWPVALARVSGRGALERGPLRIVCSPEAAQEGAESEAA
jgi:hypothetical protein